MKDPVSAGVMALAGGANYTHDPIGLSQRRAIIKPEGGMEMVYLRCLFTRQIVNNVYNKYTSLNTTVCSENVASKQLHDARISVFVP